MPREFSSFQGRSGKVDANLTLLEAAKASASN